MIQELWGMFPRLMETNINGLLDQAMPNAARSYHLYKTCKQRDLYSKSFNEFSWLLEEFYSQPRAERTKSDFDKYLQRPMDHELFDEGFHLNFRSAVIRERAVTDLASWAHNLMRVSKKTNNVVISLKVMSETLRSITQPAPHKKAENIVFEDFCEAWEKTVAELYGITKDPEFDQILTELQWINTNLRESEKNEREGLTAPAVYLTRTEIDWTLAVRQAAFERTEIPDFPLPQGPQKLSLMELDRVISLYRIVQVTKQPELIKRRDDVRITVIDRCDRLLNTKKIKMAA